MEKLLTVEEVSAILRLDPQSVRMNLRAGAIKAFRLNAGGWRVKEKDLEKFIEDNYNDFSDKQKKRLNKHAKSKY